MSRFFIRVSALAPRYAPLCVALSVALVAGGVAFALGGSGRAAGDIAPAERYCYSWDFTNNTGQDVNGLHVRLAGVQTVGSVYLGPENPFGAPDASSGYDAGTGAYTLIFGGAPVADGDTVQIGVCTSVPLLALGPSGKEPAFTWTADGVPLATRPLFAGLEWQWAGHNQLEVQVTGDAQVSTTLLSLNLLDAGTRLGLDDLNGPVVSGLPLVSQFVTDALPLDPGSAGDFGVSLSAPFIPGGAVISTLARLEPSHPYVLEAVLAAQDDPGNSIHLYSQALSPWAAVYVPVAIRN